MAGESPDRSKQRESSAQPTSGSASPVPEARSEAPPTRDPRLAVARDTERSAKRGSTDTATRVQPARTAEQREGAADAERDAGEAGSVAGAEQRAGAAKAGADAEQGESDAGAEGAAADASQRLAEEPVKGSGGSSGATGASASVEPSEPGESTGSGKASGSADGSESGEGSSGSGEREDDAAASGGRLRDTVAAWVASADEDEESAAAEGRGERAEGAGKGSGDGQEAAERAEEPTEAAEADTDGQKPEKAAEADVDARDDREAEGSDEVADAEANVQDRPKTAGTADSADAATHAPDRPKTEDPDDAADAATHAPDRPETEDPDDAAEAGAGDQGGQEKGDEAEADRSATGDGAGASEAGSAGAAADVGTGDTPEKPEPAEADSPEPDAEDTPDTDTGKGDAGPPVDQPTAVFKAVRPPVDQPTTMLKLGGAAKDAEDAPEKDAERTSKFVALKPLDDPATRKPAPAPADATAPVPTVGPERTTQQPMPPKPPLDLLAELTNTPPPPDTPLRTAVRRVKIWTPLVLLLVVVLGVVQSVRPLPAPTLELTAEDSYTFEGGKVDIPWPAKGQAALDVQGIGTFGSSGEQKPVPIASVAKVMTAYVILRDHPLKSGEDGPKIEIDQAAEDQSDAGQESTVDVTKGDKISEREALESILIASANNVARLLARWDAGSEKAFVRKMNQAALDLGMKNTTYTDPSGLNNTTVSTAVDQVKLAKAAMEQPAFREVAAMMSYVDYKGTKHDNWNRLVGYNDVTGIKTGTTTSALGNLVFSARKDVDGGTRRIVGAVVRQPAGGPDNTILGAALYEGDKLIKAAQGALESATILKKGTVVGYADDGLGGRTPVAVTEDVTAVGWAGLSVKLTFAADELPHTAKAGTKVGTLTVGDGSTNAVKVPVALQKDLVEPGFTDKLTRIG
ncbi:D-alanyl-D-alanine carboxypeptidase [Streptomyces sp. DG1A-41]|uniref:D-alanyl-D-alanine carboxypeptidase n=1 Tax=Streptomyces sp. DG1A-41 TaxID=3125779 RepID=UPI0030CFF59A